MRETITTRVSAQVAALKRNTHGKHAVARVEKLLTIAARAAERDNSILTVSEIGAKAEESSIAAAAAIVAAVASDMEPASLPIPESL
jgi:hypothetical protein